MKNLFNFLATGILFFLLTSRVSGQFCIQNISNSIIDTSSQYIIQGSIKAGTQIKSATLAMTDKAFAIISQDYAARLKFKFCGYYNTNHTIPMYNIVFANNLYCLTKGNPITGDLTFNDNIGSDAQKWILKKNDNGSYSIFNAGGNQLSCIAIGRAANLGPTLQAPFLKYYYTYEASNQFQQFNLIKLE